MEIHTIGIDLGKTVFHLVGLNVRGEVVVRKKCSRHQLLRFTANLRVALIGMEACGGAHFLARVLREAELLERETNSSIRGPTFSNVYQSSTRAPNVGPIVMER